MPWEPEIPDTWHSIHHFYHLWYTKQWLIAVKTAHTTGDTKKMQHLLTKLKSVYYGLLDLFFQRDYYAPPGEHADEDDRSSVS